MSLTRQYETFWSALVYTNISKSAEKNTDTESEPKWIIVWIPIVYSCKLLFNWYENNGLSILPYLWYTNALIIPIPWISWHSRFRPEKDRNTHPGVIESDGNYSKRFIKIWIIWRISDNITWGTLRKLWLHVRKEFSGENFKG